MTRFVSVRAASIPHSGIREIFDLARGMPGVVHFEIGEPDFDTPEPIVEAAYEAARFGYTHYTANAGLEKLRIAIAERLSAESHRVYSPQQILVTSGATEASLLAFLTTLSPGDHVLLPSPAWPNYQSQILLAGGGAIPVPLVESDGFEVTVDNLERHLTNRTTGLILNYPNNPTGATLSADKVAEVAEFARSHDLLVYSDETYVDLTYEGRSASIADYEGMQEHVVVLRTFSKTFAMTGWRVGYLAASEDIVRTATVLREHTSTCTNSVSQHAAIAALESGAAAAEEMLDQYRSRRQVVIDEFSDFEYAKLFRPRGTFYGFVNIEACGKPSTHVALLLLRRHAVAVAPGSAFGEAGEGYIRICFACPISEIREGISRIRSGLEELAAEG